MGGFLKLGESKQERSPHMTYTGTAGDVDPNKLYRGGNLGRPLDSMPTVEMKKTLKNKGLTLPTDSELLEYSKKMNAWIEAWRHDQRKEASHTWFNLFKEVDNDESGFVTFDELVTCVRRELKKTPDVISQNELMALWCRLDSSGDNMIDKDEVSTYASPLHLRSSLCTILHA